MRVITVAALVGMATFAQTPEPSFEVATVRPYQNGAPRGTVINPGVMDLRGMRLIELIALAYTTQEIQISGPSWLGDLRFDVAAKAATAATNGEMRPMLRNLLAERFKLVAHKETREMTALIMTLGKNGHKLVENNTPGSPSFSSGQLTLTGNGATLNQLTTFISRELRVPVVDRTGLDGHYNYRMEIASYVTDEMRRNAKGGVPMEANAIVAQAMQEQLGIKVDSGKVPMEVIVIDHIEKEPTEN